MRHRKNIDWASIDWTLTTKEICRLTGRVQGTVCQARKRFAPSTVRKTQKHVRWDLVDWTKPATQIQAETGASKSALCNARRHWQGGVESKSLAVRATHQEIRRWSDAAHLAGFERVSDWIKHVANKNS